MFINAETGSVIADHSFESAFRRAQAKAIAQHGENTLAPRKFYQDHMDARLKQVAQDPALKGLRLDDGFHQARQLEFIKPTVLEEKYAIPTAMSLFPVDSSVPVGARTFTVRRASEYGEAAIYRGGAPIPQVNLGMVEETFQVKHLVIGYRLDLFESQSSSFAGTDVRGRKLRAMRNIMLRRYNDLAWFGNEASAIKGVLNYPYLPKAASAYAYNGSAAADDVLADLHRWANWATDNSDDVFAPDTLAVSPRVYNYLMTKVRSATTDTTIGKMFLESSPNIVNIVSAPELRGISGASTDGMLFYKNDIESINHVLVQPFTVLPVETNNFEESVVAYMSFGGVTMPDAGNNLLVYVAGV